MKQIKVIKGIKLGIYWVVKFTTKNELTGTASFSSPLSLVEFLLGRPNYFDHKPRIKKIDKLYEEFFD